MKIAARALLPLVIAGCAAAPPRVESGFDPSGSDPRALAVVEAAIEAAGGEIAWSEVRELGWLRLSVAGGALTGADEILWDRVGERIRHVKLLPSGVATVVTASFSGRRAHGYKILPSGCRADFMASERAATIADSLALIRDDSFFLALPFSLKARGVRLTWVGARVEPTVLARNDDPPRYDAIAIERPGESEPLTLIIERATHRPVLLERRVPGVDAVVGTRLDQWRPVDGISLATARVDLGSSAGARVGRLAAAAPWRDRIRLETTDVPLEGTMTLVRQIDAHRDVEDSLFTAAADLREPGQ